MPDIPLKPIGRNKQSREGYTQIQTEEENGSIGGRANGSSRTSSTMPSAVRIAAATYKGKRPTRSSSYNYDDSRDEEETLLGSHEREELNEVEGDGFARPGGSRKTLSVSSIKSVTSWH